jgi:ABC-type multidrug transport system fused ATPase/permease subunit
MTTYRRLLRYLRPHLGIFSISVGAMIIYAALDAFSFTLLIPFLGILFSGNREGTASESLSLGDGGNSVVIDRILDATVGPVIGGRSEMDALRNVVLVLFAVYLVKNVALYVQQLSIAVVDARVSRDFRNHVYSNLVRLGLPFFQKTRAGQIISRLTVDVDQVRQLVTANLGKAVSSAIQVAFYLGTLLLLSWKLTLIAAIILPVMLCLWGRDRKR